MWCSKVFRRRHTTRALCHVLKIKGNHISICKVIIPFGDLERYCSMQRNSTETVSMNQSITADKEEYIDLTQQSPIDLVLTKKGSTNNKRSHAELESFGITRTVMTGKKRPPSIQSSIKQIDVRKSNNTRLQMTIADCIYYDGLSPLFGGSTHFCQILKLAKTVDNNFQLPGTQSNYWFPA